MMGLGTDRLVLCSFLQGDEGDFRSGTDAGREDGLAQTDIHIQMLVAGVGSVQSVTVLEHQAARAPSEYGQLHGMCVAG